MATTLKEFIRESKEDLDNFEKFWLEHSEQGWHCEYYPLELDHSGEWFEQFLVYINTERK